MRRHNSIHETREEVSSGARGGRRRDADVVGAAMIIVYVKEKCSALSICWMGGCVDGVMLSRQAKQTEGNPTASAWTTLRYRTFITTQQAHRCVTA